MELDQLQERWRQLDQKLGRTLAMNSAVLRQIGLQRTRRRINRLAVWPVIDLAFGVGVLLVTGSFLGDHWSEPTLVLPALGLMVASVLFVIDNIRQLESASRVAWDGPIADIQLAVNRLRYARIRQFKWIILGSPLVGFCGLIVGLQWLLDWLPEPHSILDKLDPWWVVANVAFGLLFVPGGVVIARALRRRWQHYPFWQNLLDNISGRSLVTVRQELKRWVELGDEPSA
jgi:hypothetical protein